MGDSPLPDRPARFRPSAWPIAVKLSIALLAASLLPLALVTAWALHRALQNAEQAEFRHLELIAQSTANRIDQLVDDVQSTVNVVAREVEIVSLLSAPPDQRPAFKESAQRTMENVVASDPDVYSVFLMDRSGQCIASTSPDNLGKDFSFREYFQDAIKGRPHTSELLTGTTSSRPGIYFSRPVRDNSGTITGVAVVKLKGETIASMIDELHSAPGRHGLMIDQYGVVVVSSNRDLQYHSLSPLPDDVQHSPAFAQRFSSVGVKQISSVGWDGLARDAVGASRPGHVSYADPGARATDFAGYAPVRARGWVLAVAEPDSEFKAPLHLIVRNTLLSAAGFAAVIAVFALLLARGITRPILRLTSAAHTLQEGQYDRARVEVRGHDEIALLGRAFNVMADGLAERERERDIFGRVVSPEVREKLLSGNLGLGGETRYVAVLFSDIRGFSTMSETMDPQDVVAMLNEYLAAMTEAVRPFKGYVNNFIGDAIVVIFGAPVGESDVEERASRAALAMRQALVTLNKTRVESGRSELNTGIGISAGQVVAGQIGSLERMLYTVIGDAVNVAARLEAETKLFPDHPILVTGAIAKAAIGKHGISLVDLGTRQVKGRSEPVELWALHELGARN